MKSYKLFLITEKLQELQLRIIICPECEGEEKLCPDCTGLINKIK